MVVIDHLFYEVLRAAWTSGPGESSCTERALAALAGERQSAEYLAEMLEEGWLEGAAERDPAGNIKAVFIRAISIAGRGALMEQLVRSAGQKGLDTLKQAARLPTESRSLDPVQLDHLKRLHLIRTDIPIALSDLGQLLLSAEETRTSAANTTIIQGITNSQVAVGSSRIKGSISVVVEPLETSKLLAAVDELTSRLTEFRLAKESSDEILADLATIRSQLASPKPKRSIIRACAENVQAVALGAASSAVYAGFVEVLKRLML